MFVIKCADLSVVGCCFSHLCWYVQMCMD